MTRHFVWLVPLINLVLFLGVAERCWPWRRGSGRVGRDGWAPRLIIALAIFPVLMVAGTGIYLEAWLLVALGLAVRVGPRCWNGIRLPLRRWLAAERPRPAGTGPASGGLDLRWSTGSSSRAKTAVPCLPPARPTCC